MGHKLLEKASKRGELPDHFVDKRIDKKAIELREVREAPTLPGIPDAPSVEPYSFGAFLLGAYQEILGDLHNLLGGYLCRAPQGR